ncbi:MAG: hypothetical protein AVDCRST_MAG33-2222, partial [uncultured Thermomicrobiales bacterium]
MRSRDPVQSRLVSVLIVSPLVSATGTVGQDATPGTGSLFEDVTVSHVIGPPDEPKFGMATSAADRDGDGDLDLAGTSEYALNRILINDGTGRLTDESDTRLARTAGDHEDVAVADFDVGGDPDLVFVGENDHVNGYRLNDSDAVFTDVTDRLPRCGTSNAVLAVDGDPDMVIGNNGQGFLFVSCGDGPFDDQAAERLPVSDDVTPDIEPGGIDRAGHIDLILGNEDGNVVLVNDG